MKHSLKVTLKDPIAGVLRDVSTRVYSFSRLGRSHMKCRSIVKAMTAVSLALLSFSSALALNPLPARAAEDRCQRGDPGWQYLRHERCLRAGTMIPARISSHRRIILRRWEDYPLNLRVTRDVKATYSDRTVIPRGSTIRGRLVPHQAWYRFEAQIVRFPSNRREDINAVSAPLYISDRYDGVFGDRPVVSAAAIMILNTILGRRYDPADSPYLGDVFTRYPRVRRELVVVYPKQDIDLRLTRDFVRE